MNVNDIKSRVERQFGDESGVQITADDIMRWINDGMLEIANKNQVLEAVGTNDIVANSPEYTIPPECLSIWTVKAYSRKVKFLSFEEANNTVNNPDDYDSFQTGQPEYWWKWGSKIILYPKPGEAAVAGLKIYFTKRPTVVTQLTDVPEIPLEYHPRIVEYCLAQAYELDEDLEFAQQKATQFGSGLTEALENEKWASREFYPRITILDEDF